MRRNLSVLVVSLLGGVLGCPGPRPPDQARDTMPRPAAPAVEKLTFVETAELGLTYKLREGVEGAGSAEPTPPAKADKLSDADTQRVLGRLAPLKADPADKKDFALRERSLPAPRPGKTVKGEFPPPTDAKRPDPTEAGALQVLRRQPEGDVPLAPHVSITFSQPMVPVTSFAELEKLPVPARLVPEPPGRWRWVGTKTLLFEPKGDAAKEAGPHGRFPMATEYTVEVAAGTKSQTGGVLDKPVRWTFVTPAVQVSAFHPQGGPVRRDPVLFAQFDQRIDREAVLKTIAVRAGGQAVRLRLATAEEIAADAVVARATAALDADGKKDRWLAFRAEELLPVDTHLSVSIGPGTPSAEGPRKTDKTQDYGFRTYGPMRVRWQNCKTAGDHCPPYSALAVSFTNPIDAKAFKKEMVVVEPALPGMKVVASGDHLSIVGPTKGRSTYKVTLLGSIPDAFGQTLGKDEPVTFVTGAAGQSLFAMGGPFVVLDPTAGPKFSVYSINHKTLRVKAFKQSPETWDEYARFMREVWSREQWPPDPPGKPILNELIQVKGEADELTETRIDLTRAGPGSVVLVVEPPVRPKNRWEWRPINTWIQVTQIGLDAMVDHDELIGWATSLKDGKPLAGVELSVVPAGLTARTDGSGMVKIALGGTAGKMLVAHVGQDVAFLPENPSYWARDGSWARRDMPETMRWYVADDRRMYKPGEEVKVKGWIRRITGGELGDVAGFGGAASSVRWKLRDARGNDVLNGETRVNAMGGFDMSFKLPGNMNLGYAQLALEALDARVAHGVHASHAIQVQEFRRPEFEVSARASEGPFVLGGHATVAVNALYYAGGGLKNAEANWYVNAAPGHFTPPNRHGWVFGDQSSWWDHYASRQGAGARQESFASRTDSAGKHVLRIDFLAVNPPRPMNVFAQATVHDVNRQAWTASANLLVHPADPYVGLKTDRPYVAKGEPIRVDAIVSDLDGKLVAGTKIELKAVRMDWDWQGGEYKVKEVGAQDCQLVSGSGDKGERCTFQAQEGGMYKIRALVVDADGRKNGSSLSVWVEGGRLPPQRGVAQERVELVPDKKEYRPGDVAEVLVIPPWYPAEAIVTLRRSGIFSTQRVTIEGSSWKAKVKVEDAWTPNVLLQVDLVGAAPRLNDVGEVDAKLPKRPAFAVGAASLHVPPVSRKLALEVKPREDRLEPGGTTTISVSLKDADGKPVAGGEVAVVIVDEAVLSLTGYRLPDPLPLFYTSRGPGALDYHLRRNVLLAKPEDLPPADVPRGAVGVPANGRPKNGGGARGARDEVTKPPPSPSPAQPPGRVVVESKMMVVTEKEAAGQQGQPQPKIRVRADFNALAVFAPSVVTDARGHADVPVKLPDNLTRYRVMAVAVAGDKQFGAGELTITARLPVMVRPSPPRFLNFGDKFELPVVIQNQTDKAMDVDVAVRVANLELTAGAGRRVRVPANDRVEVRFPVTAMKAGIARFQIGAAAAANPKWADSAELSLPVWTPATTEAFATYGVIDQGSIAQAVKMPEGVFPQFGGLHISASSTALQALTDAVIYLVKYPYECSEQMASRMMSVASLRDVLAAFQADGLPSPAKLSESVKTDVELLRRLQNWDGGWGFWKRGEESWPYLTLHVAHALTRVKDKGFDVPQQMFAQAQPYLRDIERRIPVFYGIDARRALIAYSIYVRGRMADADAPKAKRLIAEAGGVEKLPLEAVGWIYPVLSADAQSVDEVAAIRKLLQNRVEETAGAAHFTTSYSDGNYLLLHSNRRVDAIFLEGLIQDQPKSDLIPKLVTGLLAHRKAGHWASTQEDAWVLVSLDKYFNVYEKITPDFVAKIWLGDRFAGQHPFKGYTTDRFAVHIPMQWLADLGKGTKDLIVFKDGGGRLYYRIGMDYAPTDLKMPPRDNGFTVERDYEGVDNKSDVRRDADGTWRVRAGARVRVRLTMVVQARRYHVALVDPIPAGLEPMNPALAVTGVVPKDPKEQKGGRGYWWWWRPWYEHQNMRDERVEAFTSLLWEGVHTYSYVARATTPGIFVVPPVKAEEMYSPETFGRSAGDKLIVE